ncbi:MAG: SEC-C domain-containing protein [Pseudonocardia sp.]|nr:SEC-C domain-containing protein [Pseudonocardia sp.]
MSDAGWSALGVDGTHRYEAAALFGVLARGGVPHPHRAMAPVLTAQVGATWDEHRQRVERYCASVQQAGLPVQQLPADVNGFVAHLAANRVTTPGEDDLADYPDLRTATLPLESWPPARTEPCWCGSGRKYKQCCRRHGLGTLG